MAHEEQNDPVAQSSTSGIPKSPLYTTSSSSESSVWFYLEVLSIEIEAWIEETRTQEYSQLPGLAASVVVVVVATAAARRARFFLLSTEIQRAD